MIELQKWPYSMSEATKQNIDKSKASEHKVTTKKI